MNPTTKPPATAEPPPSITEERAAGAFANARFGAVQNVRRLAPGIFCCRCADGEALVALIGTADLESTALNAAQAAQLTQQLVASRTPKSALAIKVTPRHTSEVLRRAYLGNQHQALRREAWVAAPGVEFAKLTLASPTVRAMVMKRGRCSEETVWDEAIRLVIDDDHRYIAHLLPYPATLYEPAMAAAIAELPRRLQLYAMEAASATLSGDRQWNHRWRPNRHRAITVEQADRVSRALDRAVNRVRYEHLPVGAEVWVRSWEDETIWPGRVDNVEYGATDPVTVRVGYPTGYRSPRRDEVINPSSYPLERIVEPLSPLPALTLQAAREGVPVPPRRFDNDPNA